MTDPKETILVVEDEKDLVFVLSTNLRRAGYHVLSAGSAESGLEQARRRRPDLVILDIMLPGIDGLEMCRRLRQESAVPIIFLSAKGQEIDRVLGLRLGADDYVTKPFSVEELLARVAAVLKRGAAKPAQDDGVLHAGALEIDVERCEVRVKGKPRTLTPMEFGLLAHLVRLHGKPASREELLEKVWGHEQGLELSTRTVDQHVARLRRKLRPEDRRIATVRNRGYKLAV